MGRMFIERKSPTGEDGMRECRGCNKRKTLNFFYKSTNYVDGYSYLCRRCFTDKKNRVKEPKPVNKEKIKSSKDDMAKMTVCSKQDYMDMYAFFEKIGYDTTKNISQQFCDKYDLTYRERRNQDLSLYLPDGNKNPLHRRVKGKV